jgi:hypothetical protein
MNNNKENKEKFRISIFGLLSRFLIGIITNEYTKNIINFILICSEIQLFLVFVLAFLGKTEIAENLGIVIAGQIVLTIIVSATKSVFEKNSRNKYKVDSEGIPFEFTNNYDRDL